MSPTERLRELCRENGVRYTCGYTRGYRGEGGTTDEDIVTCLWVDGDQCHTTSFEESDGGELWVANTVTPEQALALALGR